MTKLRRYQKSGVRKIIKFNGRVLLADEMGLGKTIQALTYLKKRPDLRPAIIICPAYLKWVWSSQAVEHTNLRTEIINGTKPPTRKILFHQQHKNILIMNYELVQYWSDYLTAIKPKILILDECHYVKNRKTIRTKEIKIHARKIPHLIAMSGTPILSRPVELFPVLNMLWPKEFPTFSSFVTRYCDPQFTYWGWNFNGAKHIKELNRRIKDLGMIRRLKSQVEKQLPPKTRYVVPLPIQNPREYLSAKTDFIKWLEKHSLAKAARAKKAKGKARIRIGYLKRLAAQLKMKSIQNWIDNFFEENDGKLVIFGIHKKILHPLYERYKNKAVLVDGSVKLKDRQKAVEAFQNKKTTRLFIGNIKAAGTGITLTAASTVAFVEIDWVPGNHTQAEDRIHRIGQTKKAIIYYLVATNTIEEDLCRIIQKKQKTVNKVLDGGEITTNKRNIFSQLEKSLFLGTKNDSKKRKKKKHRTHISLS